MCWFFVLVFWLVVLCFVVLRCRCGCWVCSGLVFLFVLVG